MNFIFCQGYARNSDSDNKALEARHKGIIHT